MSFQINVGGIPCERVDTRRGDGENSFFARGDLGSDIQVMEIFFGIITLGGYYGLKSAWRTLQEIETVTVRLDETKTLQRRVSDKVRILANQFFDKEEVELRSAYYACFFKLASIIGLISVACAIGAAALVVGFGLGFGTVFAWPVVIAILGSLCIVLGVGVALAGKIHNRIAPALNETVDLTSQEFNTVGVALYLEVRGYRPDYERLARREAVQVAAAPPDAAGEVEAPPPYVSPSPNSAPLPQDPPGYEA